MINVCYLNDNGIKRCLIPVLERYASNNTIAITLYTEDYEEYAVITVNITGNKLSNTDGNTVFVDTNNYPWAVSFIENNGLGKLTGRTVQSGFCSYPEVRVNLEKINKEITME